MARFWKERLDPSRHVDHMLTSHIGGYPPVVPSDRLIPQWSYFVSVCSFQFEFHSMEQIQRCLEFYSQKIHPSSLRSGVTLEHYWQSWYERLPLWLSEEPKRQRVVEALKRALEEFSER